MSSKQQPNDKKQNKQSNNQQQNNMRANSRFEFFDDSAGSNRFFSNNSLFDETNLFQRNERSNNTFSRYHNNILSAIENNMESGGPGFRPNNTMNFHSPLDSMQQLMQAMNSTMQQHFPSSSGTYSSSTMVMSSSTRPGQEPKVERYMKTLRGNADGQIREAKEAYSNSHTGTEKMAMEREIQGKGMRMTRERNKFSNQTVQSDEPVNLEEHEIDNFNVDWANRAPTQLPRLNVANQRSRNDRLMDQRQAALPSKPHNHKH